MNLMKPHLRAVNPPDDRLEAGRRVLLAESRILEQVAARLDGRFLQAIDLLLECGGANPGRVVVAGTGKSADVGRKLAGTLSSTGTRAFFLDPTRAVHGDLGTVHPRDVALLLSHSGESEEIVRLVRPLRSLVRAIVALTGNDSSTLARLADVSLGYGPVEEVCPLGLAPSASTTTMLALGDALAFVLLEQRQFSPEDFARFHPAGNLGRKLLRVEEVMRHGDDMRMAPETDTVRSVFARVRHVGRRTGAVLLLDTEGRLAGLFTDSDLARLIESRRDAALDRPIREVMTRRPFTISVGARVPEAVELMQHHKISELPVVDADHRPVGLLDVTDLLALSAGGATRPAAERERLPA
jgi:arabinose-5-phosphate isomerase